MYDDYDLDTFTYDYNLEDTYEDDIDEDYERSTYDYENLAHRHYK